MIKIGTEELPLDRVVQPRLKVVLDHWTAVRGGRAMPARRDIDPQALREALGIVMIARYEPALDDFRFSLFGSEIAGAQQTDYTGKLASQLAPRAYADAVLRSYRQIRASGQPYYGRLSLAFDHELVNYHRLVLPLGDDGRTVDALLVASEHEKGFWKMLRDQEKEEARRSRRDA